MTTAAPTPPDFHDLTAFAAALPARGTLIVSNAEQTGFVSIRSGSLALEGGVIITDTFLATNSAGSVGFADGTLVTSGTVISNGQPFVVGDGQHPAVLELRGGTHVFADGLVLSPGATLRGCGTIVGEVITEGINALNCGGPGSPPFIVLQPASRAVIAGEPVTFTVDAVSVGAITFQWRRAGRPKGHHRID